MVSIFDQFAAEVLAEPKVMEELTEWFDSDRPRSATEFGGALGLLDSEECISSIIGSWMKNGRCQSLVIGYLFGLRNRLGSLPRHWIEGIDETASGHPEYAAALTLQVDVNSGGLSRVMRLIASRAIPKSYLNGFASPMWRSALQDSEKARILDSVLSSQTEDPPRMTNLGLALVAFWTKHGTIPLVEPLVEPGLKLLRGGVTIQYVDQHEWSMLLKLLAVTHPKEAVDIALEVISTPGSSSVVLADSIAQFLITLAQPHPELIMDAVGRQLLDEDKGDYFSIFRFQRLFDVIGLPILKTWVAEHGKKVLPKIAHQLQSPYLENGLVIVPPVTEWVLSHSEEDEEVFRQFCYGRHSLEVRVGRARDHRADLEKRMEQFLSHQSPQVRRWAKWELDENERDASYDAHLDEFERL